MLDFDQLKNDVAGSALHSFIAHVGIPEIGVAGRSWLYLESEFLDPWNDLLGVAEVTLLANDLALSLAARTGLRVHVVVAPSEFDPSGNPALSSALLAGDDIVGILSSSSVTVGTGYLFLN